MLDLPLPKSRHGWLAALILTGLVLLVYYLWAYPALLAVYESQLYEPESKGLSDDPGLQALEFSIRVPRALSPSTPRWVFVVVSNQGSQAVRGLQIDVVLSGGIRVPPPDVVEGQVFRQAVAFDLIAPGATSMGRIQLLTQGEDAQDLTVWVNGNQLDFAQKLPALEVNESAALTHAAVENLLLPPWSNGVIPFVVLVACYVVDVRDKDDDRGGSERHEPVLLGKEGGISFLRVLVAGAWCVFSTFMLVGAAIWDPVSTGATFGKWALIAGSLVSLIGMARVFWEKGPWDRMFVSPAH